MIKNEEETRGARLLRIFVFLMSHYNNRYTIPEIMHFLSLEPEHLRNVQRDLLALVSIEGEYVKRTQEFGKVYYQAVLEKARKIVFNEFNDSFLHFVFLKRIANIYPATASLIENLTEKIQNDLPKKEQDFLKKYFNDLNNRILFMGTQPDFDENVGKILPVILMAICKKQKLQITYTDNFGNRSKKKRVPLMVVVHQGEIYIACVSENHPDRTYALKLRRVESAKLLREPFTENPKVLEALRKRIRLGSFLLGEQNPKAEKVRLYFPNYLKNILKEKPYHPSMKITSAPGDEICVTMKVEINEQLKQWILSYGNNATVEKPKILREMLLDTAKELVKRYER